MYKDPDKQREANRKAKRKERAKGMTPQGETPEEIAQGMTKGMTFEGMTAGIPEQANIPIDKREQVPEQPRQQDYMRNEPERTPGGHIRVSKPGDADYEPQCETTRAFIEGRDKRSETPKRGKDIKVFEDLPPDVQQTIDKMSMVDGKIDQEDKAKRTAIAIHYQSLFPDRSRSTGVA